MPDPRAFRAAAATWVLGLLLAGVASAQPAAREAAARRPDVIVIMADDLGSGDVGYKGGAISTPNIDALAASGARLEHFYTTPLCSPSRAAFLTGRHPFRYGLQRGVLRPWAVHGLPRSERTLAETLRTAGYATHLVGKWHLGLAERAQLPTGRGFDHHYGTYTGAVDYFTHRRLGRLDWHRDGEPLVEAGYATTLLGDEAVRVVEQASRDRPLFLFVAFTAPHRPLQAEPRDLDAQPNELGEQRRLYSAMVAGLDREVGRIVRAIDARAAARPAFVFFLSDNGASRYGGGSNRPFRLGKGHLHEGGVRVPAIARLTGRIPEGRVIDEPTHVVDLAPTIARLGGAGGDASRPSDGVDLLPLLVAGEAPEREHLLVHLSERGAALRSGRFKLVMADAWEPGAGTVALFDVVADPGESRDLAGEQPERVARMRAEVLALRDARVPPIPAAGERWIPAEGEAWEPRSVAPPGAR